MNCTFVDNASIWIGNRVLIAPNVLFYTASHPVLPQERFVSDWEETGTTFFRTYARSIEIQDNVWIGGAAVGRRITKSGTGRNFLWKDAFDRARYERIREIAAEMISYKTDIPKNKVKNLFCSEIGY